MQGGTAHQPLYPSKSPAMTNPSLKTTPAPDVLDDSVRVAPLPSRRKLWLAAIKPPMYSVAIMPICLGTAVAYYTTGVFHGAIFSIFCISAILILAWENISNDVFDSETGIDQNKHHSLVNLTQRKNLVFAIGNLLLALGIAGIISISVWQKDFTVLGLILLCCFLGYTYQGPPFRLGYQGLGEILCFFAFGPVGLAAVYYSQAQAWSWDSLTASVPLGITTSLVLFCSHFHQVEDDIQAGKTSPIVRLGTLRGSELLTWICGSVFIYIVGCVLAGLFPVWTLITVLSFPLAVRLYRHVSQNHDQPERVSNCKFYAIHFHFVSGVLLCLGFILG